MERVLTTGARWVRALGFVTILVGSVQISASAQNTMSGGGADADFVRKASAGGMAEVKLGQLAQEKASSAAVKEFGKRMEEDHSKAGDKLKRVASQEGMDISSSMNTKDQALYDKLSSVSGAHFDRAYMSAMVKDHKEDVAEFQKEANHGTNAKVKSFASEILPTLKEHLTMAESTMSELGHMKSASNNSSH